MYSNFNSKMDASMDVDVTRAHNTKKRANGASKVKQEDTSDSASSPHKDLETSKTQKARDPRSKSKFGCLTCKVRKKKCEGTKPVCRDCRRFSKECVWIDYDTMKVEEIRCLRMKVKEQESCNKVRIRRPRETAKQKRAPAPRPVKESTTETASPVGKEDEEQPNIKQEMTDIPRPKEPQIDPQAVPSNEALDYVRALRDAYPVQSPGPNMTFDNDAGYMSLGDIHHNAMMRSRSPMGGFKLIPSKSPTPRALSPTLMDFDALDENNPSSPPSGLLSFLKEVSAFNGGINTGLSPQIEDQENIEESKEDALVKLSPGFNLPNFLDQVSHAPGTSTSQLNQLASAFNATFIPHPQPPPPLLPELDASGHYLYDYYVNTLSRKVSIAPVTQNESNSYQKVFLPLAQRDKGVLCGILAWAGFHLGGQWTAEASMYAESAVKLLTQDIDFSGAVPAHHEDRRAILNKLAVLLILCGAEICRGDVKYWSVYLNWGWRLLKDNGGITKFDNNKEEHWLITNFAYHDVLASSVNERGTYFPLETYQKIFKDPQGVSKGNLNPLLGVSKILYRYIAEISSLSWECKNELDAYYKRQSPKVTPLAQDNVPSASPEGNSLFDEAASEVSEHGRVGSILYSILARAQKLEHKIDNARPDADDLENLNDTDLEMQLMCFESFQISCKLFLRQSILKLNPSSIESQILMNDLMKSINLLVETPMQATLVFPLFIAGIHSVAEYDREHMRDILNQMMETYGPWNVVRIKYVMEQVWEQNPHGDKVVDWLSILKQLGWEINFA